MTDSTALNTPSYTTGEPLFDKIYTVRMTASEIDTVTSALEIMNLRTHHTVTTVKRLMARFRTISVDEMD